MEGKHVSDRGNRGRTVWEQLESLLFLRIRFVTLLEKTLHTTAHKDTEPLAALRVTSATVLWVLSGGGETAALCSSQRQHTIIARKSHHNHILSPCLLSIFLPLLSFSPLSSHPARHAAPRSYSFGPTSLSHAEGASCPQQKSCKERSTACSKPWQKVRKFSKRSGRRCTRRRQPHRFAASVCSRPSARNCHSAFGYTNGRAVCTNFAASHGGDADAGGGNRKRSLRES